MHSDENIKVSGKIQESLAIKKTDTLQKLL